MKRFSKNISNKRFTLNGLLDSEKQKLIKCAMRIKVQIGGKVNIDKEYLQ